MRNIGEPGICGPDSLIVWPLLMIEDLAPLEWSLRMGFLSD